MPRTPKTLRIEDLRRHLGDERVDDLVRSIVGTRRAMPPSATRISRQQLDRTVALVNGEAVGNARRAWIGTVPVFRYYFAESAQRRRFFNEWAERIRDSLPEEAGGRRRSRRAREATEATAEV